jgi:hypothetical protein
MTMQTYWIYYNNYPLTAVRLPRGSTEKQIRLASNNAHVVCNRPIETPFEFELKCCFGEIRE